MKHCVWHQSALVALVAGALLACGSDSDDAQRPEPQPQAMNPETLDAEGQLLSYTCRQDETKRSTPLASVDGVPPTLRDPERRSASR